jgi:galactokinase
MKRLTAAWRAPGRVNLVGEHTDYNGGFCLPFAIRAGCTATVASLPEPVVEVVSDQYPAPVELPWTALRPGALAPSHAWAGYAAGVVWAAGEGLRRPAREIGGISVHLDSDLPIGAGLASSAAVGCAVAAALDDLLELGMTRSELAALARRAENDFVGAPTGGLDQLVALGGEPNQALFCDLRSNSVEFVPFDLERAGLTVLVIDSRAPHHLATGEYARRREECHRAAQELDVAVLRDISLTDLDAALTRLSEDVLRRRVHHVVTENDRTLAVAGLLRTGQLRRIGPLLTASHASLRDDFEVSIPQIDLAVEVMLAFGALGARITGGGFGGCAIGLMDPAQARAAAVAVAAAYSGLGYPAPHCFTVRAESGARPVPT